MRRKFCDISEGFDFDNQDSCLDDDFVERYNKEKVFEKFRNFWNNDLRPYMLRKNLVMIPIGNWFISLPVGNGRRITIEERNGKNQYEVITAGVIQDYKISKEDEDLEDSYEYLNFGHKQSFVNALAEILDHKDFNRVNEGFDFDSEDFGMEDSIENQVESYNVVRFKSSLMELVNLLKEFFKVCKYRRSVIWNKNDQLIQIFGSCKDFIVNPEYFKIMMDHNDRMFLKILPNDIVIAISIRYGDTRSITLEDAKKWTARVNEIKSLLKFGIERFKKGGFNEAIDDIAKTIYNLAKNNPHRLNKYGSLNTEIYDTKEFQKIWRPTEDTLMGIEEIWMTNPSDYEISGKIGKIYSGYPWGSSFHFVNPIDFDYYYNNIISALK